MSAMAWYRAGHDVDRKVRKVSFCLESDFGCALSWLLFEENDYGTCKTMRPKKPTKRDATKGAGRADRFAWLFGTDEATPAVQFSAEELAPACALMLRNWQVLPVTAPRLQDWIDRGFQDSPEVRNLRDVTAAVRALARMQMLLANRFAEELERRGVPHVFMKGIATAFALYPELDLRSGLDVDIGVPEGHIRAAERIAREQGFVPAAFDPDNRHVRRISESQKQMVEAEHYELACLNRRQVVRGLDPDEDAAIRRSIPLPRAWHETEDGQLACYVTLDIHHGICLDIEVDSMVDSARRDTRNGYSAWIPQPEWMMLQLIFKIYWEGVQRYNSRGVYQFADVVRLVPQIQGETASRLFDLLKQYELEAGAYYVFRVLESAFGIKLTHELHEFLVRASIPPRDKLPEEVNDKGDMWPRLWGER